MDSSSNLQFLKLGGSLITDKTAPLTARADVLSRLSAEIAAVKQDNPTLHLVLGHGSGSFGHFTGKKFGTRRGVRTPREWKGFAEVWHAAASLNRLVMEALHQVGLPAVAFPPSAAVTAASGRVVRWDLAPLRAALHAGLLPVIFGDVVFDTQQGGTILSTEDLFAYLVPQLHPSRLLLAGLEPGVWADYPDCTTLVQELTPQTFPQYAAGLGGSAATDVTGGMIAKVKQSLELAEQNPDLEVFIFSGEAPLALTEALLGKIRGTRIHSASA